MKTKQEIQKEIKALKVAKNKVEPRSFFGEDNLARVQAQIDTLEKNWDNDDIYDQFGEDDDPEQNLGLIEAALDAVSWRDEDGDQQSKEWESAFQDEFKK